jgi:SAM-dependent methyltransferase
MTIQCPICQEPNGCERYERGICQRITPELKAHVDAIYTFRERYIPQMKHIQDYNVLPHISGPEWQIRAEGLRVVQDHLADRRPANVLEIGAWNGWLSHHIRRMGHPITALEYSDHPTLALGAMRHYDTTWHAIQMDLTNLQALPTAFDYVIVNHGLHLFPDPHDLIKQAGDKCLPGGTLIVLGIITHADATWRIQQVAAQNKHMQAEYNQPYFLKPARGYLDAADREALQAYGLQLIAYRCRWRANLKAWFVRTAPRYAYGIMRRP